MKVTVPLLIFCCLIGLSCFGQRVTPIEVSKPELSLNGNIVQIRYQILGSSSADTFQVRLRVTGSEGGQITARALSGDLGSEVAGGGTKTIEWDIQADSIFLDEEVFFEVFALQKPVTLPEEITGEEPLAEQIRQPEPEEEILQPAPEDEMRIAVSEGSSFKRNGIMLQSALFPGLGLTRINNGKPHWIKGVAGYGCIAASIYLNSRARSVYEEYKGANQVSEVDRLYEQSARQDAVSEILAYGAIGIWASDLLWTYLGTAHLGSGAPGKGFALGSSMDGYSNSVLLSVRYRF